MKVVFIHASISSCGFDSFGKKNDYIESTWINHGLCYISAYAKSKGFHIDLIDLRELKGWNDFKDKIRILEPAVIGLGMMSVDFNYVMKSIDLIKEINEEIKIVVGGQHPTLMLEEVTSNPKIDHIILGEGEISFTNLLQDISGGKENIERVIQGIKPDLERLPFADRNLYKSFEEPIFDGFPRPFVTTIVGRGCIYNCNFCQPAEKIIFGDKVRRRSVENIIEELISLRKNYNFQSFMIHDDCLTEDKEWIWKFCKEYKANGFSQPFVCQVRADHICQDEYMIKEMKEAGLKMLIIGFESGNQRILNFLRKGTTVEQNYKAAEICRKYGIGIWANYMLGIPTETKKEAMDTLRMIKRIKPERPSPSFYTPQPGSDLYNYCIKNNLSLIVNHDDYRRNPSGEKIVGIDYQFLNNVLLESIGFKKKDRFIRKILSYKLLSNFKNKLKKTIFGKKIINCLKQILRHGR